MKIDLLIRDTDVYVREHFPVLADVISIDDATEPEYLPDDDIASLSFLLAGYFENVLPDDSDEPESDWYDVYVKMHALNDALDDFLGAPADPEEQSEGK